MNESPPSLKRLRRTSGVYVFLALSGLVPLARYGVFSQWILLLHIAAGLLAVVPLSYIFWKHGLAANRQKPTPWWSAGLWAGLGWAILGASGLWLVAKGIGGIFVPYQMHEVHLVAGIVLGAVGIFHIGYGLTRSQFPSERYRELARPVVVWLIVLAVGAGWIFVARRQKNLPVANFAPSNARTTTGRVIPAQLLGNSASCGASGCHSAIYEQWAPGAHHFSASDPFYQTVKANYIRDRGPNSPHYCAGCHEPLPLISGEQILPKTQEHGAEGSSCAFCHSLRDTETRGNANYSVRPPDPYLFELSSDATLRKIAGMLIRLHPEQHRRDYDLEPSKTAEFCGTCHKQYLNKEVNGWGFVQLQNQLDDWKNGPWHTDPRRQLQCQNCHMREIPSDDPARNAQGFIHDHRILAANDFVPEMLDLPGAKKQTELVHEWLSGRTVIPEIAKVWPGGPIVPVQVEAEGTWASGREAAVRVLLTNRKVGHAIPTGPLDVIQAWVELQVTDSGGRPVWSTGMVGPDGQIVGKTIEYRTFFLDKNAQLVFTHAIWDVVATRDKRVIPPGESDTAEFRFLVPRNATGPLRCRARFLYHKFNPQSVAALFPDGHAPKIPILEISRAEIEVPLGGERPSARAAALAPALPGNRGL